MIYVAFSTFNNENSLALTPEKFSQLFIVDIILLETVSDMAFLKEQGVSKYSEPLYIGWGWGGGWGVILQYKTALSTETKDQNLLSGPNICLRNKNINVFLQITMLVFGNTVK